MDGGAKVTSATTGAAAGGAKRRLNLPKDSIEVLMTWLSENRYNAYPNDAEKSTLARDSNLSILQVCNWFINARRRILPNLIRQEGNDPGRFTLSRRNKRVAGLAPSALPTPSRRSAAAAGVDSAPGAHNRTSVMAGGVDDADIVMSRVASRLAEQATTLTQLSLAASEVERIPHQLAAATFNDFSPASPPAAEVDSPSLSSLSTSSVLSSDGSTNSLISASHEARRQQVAANAAAVHDDRLGQRMVCPCGCSPFKSESNILCPSPAFAGLSGSPGLPGAVITTPMTVGDKIAVWRRQGTTVGGGGVGDCPFNRHDDSLSSAASSSSSSDSEVDLGVGITNTATATSTGSTVAPAVERCSLRTSHDSGVSLDSGEPLDMSSYGRKRRRSTAAAVATTATSELILPSVEASRRLPSPPTSTAPAATSETAPATTASESGAAAAAEDEFSCFYMLVDIAVSQREQLLASRETVISA